MSPPATFDYRFPFRTANGDQPFRDWLIADLDGAQLSRLFRAYYRVRSLIPLRIRQLLQRTRQVRASDRWYLPDEFFHAWARELLEDGGWHVIHPWPDEADFAFVLTHDVETADGMRRVSRLADLEEELGFRSSWNIVPYKYPVDAGLLKDLRARGFEIGVHGYNHDGKLFTSRATFNKRAPKINAALESFEAVGFRAPMVHRNLGWLQALNLSYDASCFDVDPYQAMPGGVGSPWPFIAGRFVELPYTLPQDHSLFVALGDESGRIWDEKLAFVARLRGMALLVTHPDYLNTSRRLDVYRQFLLAARELSGMWRALPREVATWWRERDELSLDRCQEGQCRIQGAAASRARVAHVGVNTEDAADNQRLSSGRIQWSQPLSTVRRTEGRDKVFHSQKPNTFGPEISSSV